MIVSVGYYLNKDEKKDSDDFHYIPVDIEMSNGPD